MEARHWRRGRVRVLHDAALSAVPESWWFDFGELERRGLVTGRGGGRGSVVFFRSPFDPDEQWVLRHYMRGGTVARILGDRYLWQGLAETRPWREWTYTARLYDEGLPVPRPVAGRVVRSGPLYAADLITVRVPGARSLDENLGEDGVPDATWRAVGACIRRFHDAGHWHPDLNSRNILIAPDGRVSVIDWDRGRHRAGTDPDWREANLQRLRRDLEKRLRIRSRWVYTDACFVALRAGYEAGAFSGD
ncbi:3-deoxy-D-manno-octulosonic acid kinase [Thioalkalivibrio sp. ARh3]|uniref:3-deoxy-D-manno-octulosonic acid kinase n=1 Tax=Thioalkalivibrio sp. ARh3 TaxID=1158148 RepID=UPI000382D224|nr:3-deoxy-D-manno-octulosonic acid kinase [Thioalkalivibrio sp. ARh3]